MKTFSSNQTTLGDFTTTPRVLMLVVMAVIVGLVATISAWILVSLISFVTNLAFFGKFSIHGLSIVDHTLGMLVIFVPIIGGLVIGFMARYGSEKIRGHGIPEALEAILIGKSQMQPKIAILKPLSSAISIGTGGPFGAEGPIIMTGGSLGSLFAQMFHLTSSERKTLLVSGAAAGMTAIFATPIASVLLAVELLLFEWKPRSLIPVVSAAIAASLFRMVFFAHGPLFPFDLHYDFSWMILMGSLVIGLTAGLCSNILSCSVYLFEDLFEKLSIHWMWWPAIGGIAVGIGGFIDPAAMGVGYDNIRAILNHSMPETSVILLLIVKTLIWSIALGSGTSGGVLAPLLIIGGAAGFLEGGLLPGDKSYWALLCMAATMGGTMRAPLTATLFAVELTGDLQALLPLIVSCIVAYTFTVLLLRRSILTEKLARRGQHITCEYSIDPFSITQAKDIMVKDVITLPASMSLEEVVLFFSNRDQCKYKSYPVIDDKSKVVGMVNRNDVFRWMHEKIRSNKPLLNLVINQDLFLGSPEDFVGSLSDQMAERGLNLVPIVDREDHRLIGLISGKEILSIRAKVFSEEKDRATFFKIIAVS
jgi:H+/Cl- antiporter ClcA/CBS domain-containing protein